MCFNAALLEWFQDYLSEKAEYVNAAKINLSKSTAQKRYTTRISLRPFVVKVVY